MDIIYSKVIYTEMSSIDSDIHYAQYLIRLLQNTVPSIPLVKHRNLHNEVLRFLVKQFNKATSPARSLRVVQPEHHQPIIKKRPNNHAEPSRVPIVEAYP